MEYYGGVDTTPLFVMLAGAYAVRTGDLALIDECGRPCSPPCSGLRATAIPIGTGSSITPAARIAASPTKAGRTASDSVFDADGRDVEGPVALVEVQGYVFAAFRAMAELTARRGAAPRNAPPGTPRRSGCAALSRSGSGSTRSAPMPWRWTGMAGHAGCVRRTRAIYCSPGSRRQERGGHVASQLLGTAFNTGWGIRTLGRDELRYNPISYHNGSVRPHDTALCAAGMAQYGARDGAAQLLSKMSEAAVNFDMRLPELFCGFQRPAAESPIAYPVACLPQAWAAGSVFMMLQACLGLRIDGWRNEIYIDHPCLPVGIDRLTVRHLAVGNARINLTFQCLGGRMAVSHEGQDMNNIPIRLHVNVV